MCERWLGGTGEGCGERHHERESRYKEVGGKKGETEGVRKGRAGVELKRDTDKA